MIVNTGSRTDIPAFYSEWFYNRISQGYVLTRNPYYPEQVSKILLSPNVVDVLCFCTKDPKPMLSRLHEIDKFRQFWFVTITAYGKDIEPRVPAIDDVIDSFIYLSEKVGERAIGWRYDPIFLSDQYSAEYHVKTFNHIAKRLSGHTHQCVVSFIDLYEKTKRNFPQVREVSALMQEHLAEQFVGIGDKYKIKIYMCCENPELLKYGVDVSGCMTQDVIESAIGCKLCIPKGKKPARTKCNCLLGNDIGMYNTCGHECRYCYANYDKDTVISNMKQHDSKSPFLTGHERPGDIVKQMKQESYIDSQMNIFDWMNEN